MQSAPFFTNDLLGLVKIAGVFGTMAGAIIYFFWKIMQAPFRAETAKVAEDLNKVGERVNVVEKTMERHDQRLDVAERDVDRMRTAQEFLMKELGRLESDVRASIDESREARTQRNTEVNAMRESMAGMKKELEIGGRLLGTFIKQKHEHE